MKDTHAKRRSTDDLSRGELKEPQDRTGSNSNSDSKVNCTPRGRQNNLRSTTVNVTATVTVTAKANCTPRGRRNNLRNTTVTVTVTVTVIAIVK